MAERRNVHNPDLKKKNNNKKAERQCSAETQPTLEGGGGATKIIN